MRRCVRVPLLASVSIGVALSAVVGGAPAAQAAPVVTSGCVESVPDPDSTAPVNICFSVFQPDGASAASPVPMVMHSHGWGGSRTTDAASFAYLLEAGFGVLSFDQRGFGESGGYAQIEHPDYEGKDVQKLVDHIAGLDWVEKDGPNDPVLGAIGGSYGGGFQLVGAFSELRDHGATRFDALAPEITWNSLTESLFPQGVPRTGWVTTLTAAAVPSNALPPMIYQGLVESAATGNVPPYLEEFFVKNGPAWHVAQGRRLDIPTLWGQGGTDNLFPLSEGLKNFQEALTPDARARSIFVAYNGGHALPSVLPQGTGGEGDACSPALGSPSFSRLALRFLQQNLQGKAAGLGGFGKYHLTTAGGRCVTVPAVQQNTSRPAGDITAVGAGVGIGVPVSVPIADGPLTIAGSPTLDATVTAYGLDNRAFAALSVGTSPNDARIVQNNMLPIREVGVVTDKRRTGIELPSVAVDVPEGQKLFLTVSPFSDMSLGFGTRIVGAMQLSNVTVHLPVAGSAGPGQSPVTNSGCTDRARPKVTAKSRKLVVRPGAKVRVKGKASDDCAIESVVASVRTVAEKGQPCRTLTRSGKLKKSAPCRDRFVLPVRTLRKDGSSWRFTSPKGLPRGTYRLVVRAVDEEGRASKAGKRSVVRVRVR